jgi:hypothetical protein
MDLIVVQNVGPGFGTQVTLTPVAFAFPESVVVVVSEVDVEVELAVEVEVELTVAVVVVVELFPLSLLLPPQAAKRIINIPSKIKPIIFFIVVVSLRLSCPSNFRNAATDIIMQKRNFFDRKIVEDYKGIAGICQFILKSLCSY